MTTTRQDDEAIGTPDSKAQRLRTALIEMHGAEVGTTLFDMWAKAEGASQRRFEEMRNSLRWRYAGEGPEPSRESYNTPGSSR